MKEIIRLLINNNQLFSDKIGRLGGLYYALSDSMQRAYYTTATTVEANVIEYVNNYFESLDASDTLSFENKLSIIYDILIIVINATVENVCTSDISFLKNMVNRKIGGMVENIITELKATAGQV